MDRKTIIKLVILLLCIMIAITLVEIFIKYLRNKPSINEAENDYTPVISEKQKKIEDNFISETDEVLKLFNERDYETIYSKLNEIYSKAKYPTYDIFESEMKKLINDNTKIEIKEKFKHSRGYYAILSLDNGNEIPLTVNNLYSGNMTIMFDHIYSIEEIDDRVGAGNITIKFKYMLKYLSKIGYIIEINNDSNKDCDFRTFNTYQYGSSKLNKEQYYVVDNIDTILLAKSNNTFELQFLIPSGEMFPPDTMNLCFSVNGEIYQITIDLNDDAY